MKSNRCTSIKLYSERLAWIMSGLVASAFISIIILEIARTGTEEQDNVVATAQPQSTAPAMPGPQKPMMGAELTQVILARPLFSPGRHPASDGAPSGLNAAKPLPRLTGVMVIPAGGFAVFAGGEDGKTVVVGPGGRVGDAIVEAIAAGQVTLRRPDGLVVLHPISEDAALQVAQLDSENAAKPGDQPRQESNHAAFWRTVAASRSSDN